MAERTSRLSSPRDTRQRRCPELPCPAEEPRRDHLLRCREAARTRRAEARFLDRDGEVLLPRVERGERRRELGALVVPGMQRREELHLALRALDRHRRRVLAELSLLSEVPHDD